MASNMIWCEWVDDGNNFNGAEYSRTDQDQQDSHVNFDFLSLLAKPKDYYKLLEVDYDATEDAIRSNYIRLALKWHPDKQKGQECATSTFQEINDAYQFLSDPVKRSEYDSNGMLYVYDYDCNVVRPDIDMQWPWDEAFNFVKPNTVSETSKRFGAIHAASHKFAFTTGSIDRIKWPKDRFLRKV